MSKDLKKLLLELLFWFVLTVLTILIVRPNVVGAIIITVSLHILAQLVHRLTN